MVLFGTEYKLDNANLLGIKILIKEEYKIESCGKQSLQGYSKKIPIYKVHYNKTSLLTYLAYYFKNITF